MTPCPECHTGTSTHAPWCSKMDAPKSSNHDLCTDLRAMARYQQDVPDRECALLLNNAADEIERLRKRNLDLELKLARYAGNA